MSTKIPAPTPGAKPMTPPTSAAKPMSPTPVQPANVPPTRMAAPMMTQPMTGTTPMTSGTVNPPTFSMTPTHQQIAQRAYERWLKRGRPQGTHLQDWFEAEAELKREITAKTGQKV
jgi:hypothetical protein